MSHRSARARARRSIRPAARLTAALLRWYDSSHRALPWRAARDPYHVWVAEVVLQQTRVEQAIPLYERFTARFPTVRALSEASEQEVLKIWEGAGYYARARDLRRTARRLVGPHTVEWPTRSIDWERLPGVGHYIARAVASQSFAEPVVALDSNGRRVAARWWLEKGDVRSTRVLRRLEERMADALSPRRPGDFNQAVMELGETICLPRSPRCPECPVASHCRARQELPDPAWIPSPRGRRPRPQVEAAVALVQRRGRWLVRRRPSHGLLGGLWELPGGKVEPGEAPTQAIQRELAEEAGIIASRLRFVGVVRHAYSHFSVRLHLFTAGVAASARPRRGEGRLRWVTPSQFGRLPRPLATIKAMRLVASRRRGRR